MDPLAHPSSKLNATLLLSESSQPSHGCIKNGLQKIISWFGIPKLLVSIAVNYSLITL